MPESIQLFAPDSGTSITSPGALASPSKIMWVSSESLTALTGFGGLLGALSESVSGGLVSEVFSVSCFVLVMTSFVAYCAGSG